MKGPKRFRPPRNYKDIPELAHATPSAGNWRYFRAFAREAVRWPSLVGVLCILAVGRIGYHADRYYDLNIIGLTLVGLVTWLWAGVIHARLKNRFQKP